MDVCYYVVPEITLSEFIEYFLARTGFVVGCWYMLT